MDNFTGSEDHDLFDEEDDGSDGDVRHFGEEGFEDDYDEGEEEDEDNSWSDLGRDIDPDESASRSRSGPSRQHSYPPVRDPPRQQARGKYPAVVDPPPGPPPPRRRGAGSRDRRPPRPRSVADNLDDDGYPYGRSGQLPYHPAPGWTGVGIGYPGGHAHTVLSGYADPFAAGSLIYPYSDPFSPYSGGANPFSDDYFGPRRNHRNSMPPRPNNELMAFNQGYPGPFPPYGGFPPYGPYGYPFPPPHGPSPAPPPPGSNKSTPAPKEDPEDPKLRRIEEMLLDQRKRELERQVNEARAKEIAKRQAEEDKLEALRGLIEKHNKEQLEREKKAEEKAKKEADEKEKQARAAADAKKAAEEKEKELKEAAKKAKEDAEKEAKKKQDEEKEKWDKLMEEQKKKAAELEEKKKKLEEENKKLKPGDDMLKPPIKFKDAVGRKFSFPWHLCKTWKVSVPSHTLILSEYSTDANQGMKALIDQAFLYVEPIGQHVHEGHYDLVGPDGEIILPQVWETMVKPDWSITMQMWPMPERKDQFPPPPPGAGAIPMPLDLHGPHKPGKKDKHPKDRGKIGKSHVHAIPAGVIPPPPVGPPPPAGMPVGLGSMLPPPPQGPPPPPGTAGVMEIPGPAAAVATALGPPAGHRSSSKKKKKEAAGLALWFAGGPVNRRDSLKYGKEIEDRSLRSRAAERVSAFDASSMPIAENGMPLRESAPNGKAVKRGRF